MESARSHTELAETLADNFTMYLPDRRGRGLSGRFGANYSARKDVEDMDALLTATCADLVFGVSSGAIIWLHAALIVSDIHRAVIFEPPLSVDGSWAGTWSPASFLRVYDQELAKGKLAFALAMALKTTRMGPPLVPAWRNGCLSRKAQSDDVTMRMLAPTLGYDAQLIVESEAHAGLLRPDPRRDTADGQEREPSIIDERRRRAGKNPARHDTSGGAARRRPRRLRQRQRRWQT